MNLSSRKVLDRSFTGLGLTTILLLCLSLVVVLGPIFYVGTQAFVFRGTVEFRQMILEEFERGDREAVMAEVEKARQAREKVSALVAEFERGLIEDEVEIESSEQEIRGLRGAERRERREALRAEKAALEDRQAEFQEFRTELARLFGPLPGDKVPKSAHLRYGMTRWGKTEERLHDVLYKETWDYSAVTGESSQMGRKVYVPRSEIFAGTSLKPVFGMLESDIEAMMLPEWTFYWRFLTDNPVDSHYFGGIWPEVLGTLYLTLGAILFAVPIGIISAIYLVEYAGETLIVRSIRTFINTLAGVPSIVFGLFGLAFFINAVGVSESKSVLAGSLTLGLVILPVVIRASEEAIRSVPHTYKEGALSLGAGHWRTICTVILPAALPGIVTGIIISMGRAAGETAPIIFTAAVSVGQPLALWETLSQPSPALSWNIYNLAQEHEASNEIQHVQYGMVLTLVALVLLLNATAIYLRARISKSLRG